jgi:hypothetical protein
MNREAMITDEFNPLDHPVMFQLPQRVLKISAWNEHLPFAMFLVSALRPRTIVELGTHGGASYCAFCQTVVSEKLDTRCFAVDTWMGDENAGRYGGNILSELKSHHDPLYASFSELIRATFDDANARFKPGEVDLLHIDGLHTYEAVRHDFDTWLPKVSGRGVILFHDTAVRDRGFGVYRLMDELRGTYPLFEFEHGAGLGVMRVGDEHPPAVKAFFARAADHPEEIRQLFAALGERLTLQLHQAEMAKLSYSIGWHARRIAHQTFHTLAPVNSARWKMLRKLRKKQ